MTLPDMDALLEGACFPDAETREAVKARIAAALPQWRTMDSAPKDGTLIIGGFWSVRWADSHRKGDVVKCWWQPEFDAFISSCRQMTLAPNLRFENGKQSQLHSPIIESITHWMPLPAPKEPT